MKVERVKRLAVVGASARAAAFSALRAGFEVVTADLFADADLAAVCDAARAGAYPYGLVDWLATTQCDAWLYTGALENYPALVDRLAMLRPLLGNRGDALRRVRDPFVLQRELARAALRFPETVAEPGGLPRDGSWLCKTYRSASGVGVWSLDGEAAAERCEKQQAVCQRFVEGVAAAAVFVVSQQGSRLLGATRQVVGESWAGAGRWQYAGSVGPLTVSPSVHRQLTSLGGVLADRFRLRGVVGVDFILADDDAWIVEINPRYPASSEIVERSCGQSAIAGHVAACVGEENAPGARVVGDRSELCGKAILFARRDVTISATFAGWAQQRSSLDPRRCSVADIPHAGEAIAAGHPVATVFASAPPERYDEAMRQRIAEVERRLYAAG